MSFIFPDLPTWLLNEAPPYEFSAHTRSTVLEDPQYPSQLVPDFDFGDDNPQKALQNTGRLAGATAPFSHDLPMGASTSMYARQSDTPVSLPSYIPGADSSSSARDSGLLPNAAASTMSSNTTASYGMQELDSNTPFVPTVRQQPCNLGPVAQTDVLPQSAPWLGEHDLYYQSTAPYMDGASQPTSESSVYSASKDPLCYRESSVPSSQRAFPVSQGVSELRTPYQVPTTVPKVNIATRERSSSPQSMRGSSWNVPGISTQPNLSKQATAASRSKSRPFVCSYCSRAFARKHDLERHARVHSGDRPYVCTLCKKGFPRSDALRRHMRVEHDKVVPYWRGPSPDLSKSERKE